MKRALVSGIIRMTLMVLGLPSVAAAQLVVGPGPGGTPTVQLIEGTTTRTVDVFNPAFLGGASLTLGDVNGDGTLDIIAGAGPGGGPHVRVLSGVDFSVLASFYAYDPAFPGGVNVAAGDINGDGRTDIITGAGPSGGPHVRVFSGIDLSVLASFYAYDPAFPGGVSVAAGDVDGDGRADIVTGAGPSGGPHVRVFSGTDLHVLASFYAYDPAFPGGVSVAAGDVNGDGRADIITGAGPSGGPHVRVFSGTDLGVLASFYAYDPVFLGGVGVAAGDVNGDGRVDLITGAGPGGGPHVRIFSGIDLSELASFYAPTNGSGVSVGSLGDTPGLRFTSASTTSFVVGSAGSFTITTAGNPPPAITSSGALPAGVTFTDNGNGTATLAGTPGAGASGAYPLTLTANNGAVPAVTQSFTLSVHEAPAITSPTSTAMTIGAAGSFTVTTTGFPVPTLTIGGAALPAGIFFLDNGDGTGTLSGTPAAGSDGVYAITFTADNGVSPAATQSFTLTVSGAPTFTSANSVGFVVGTLGTFTITTTGSPAPAITRMGVLLPAGVTFVDNGNGTGTLSGTPAAGTAGSYAFTFTATNSTPPSAVQAFTLNVNQPPAITSGNTDTFTVGTADSFTVTTTGFPAPTVSQTGPLPAGITFTSATRVLGGIATQTGTFSAILFTATNGIVPDAVQTFTLNVVCPPITVNPATMPDGLFQVAYAGVTFVQTGSTGSAITWSATGLPAGLAIGPTTGLVSGTPTNTVLNGAVSVTATDNFGCTSTRNTTITVRPMTDNENYTGGVGNTQYVVGTAVPSTPHVLNADLQNTNVKMGDNGPGTLTVTFPATSPNGILVEGATDGTFTYTPNVGFAGPTDTFTYTLTDGNGVTNTGTVTINLSQLVWYVNSSGGNGDGRSHNPFDSLANAEAPSSANSYIFVHSGGASTPGNLTMDVGQTLRGQGGSLPFTLNGMTILQGTAPTLTGTVTLVNATQVVAVNFTPTAIPALVANGTTAVTIDTVNVTGGTNALSLTNATGVVNVINSSFTNATDAEVLVSGGTANVNIGATISSNAGRSIDIQNRTAGTVSFTGPITDTAQGIFLNANTGSTINFSGGLSLSTTTNPAFTATAGGTVSATQNNTTVVNAITTTTGTALNVTSTTIGASGLTFQSISANGAANGIVLNNTGATAGLTVTGNAGTCTSAATCTGGSIQNTTGDGLALTSTRNVSLTRLFVGTAANHGINANAVNGLTLSASRVQDSGNGDNEHSLNLVNVTGTVTIDATTFSNASEDLIHLENNNTNVTLNVTNSSQFSYPASVGAFANSAILLLPGGTAAVTASIQNSTFTNIRGVAAQISANLLNSTGTQNFTFSNNTINVTIAGRASGVVVGGQELTTTNITIANNAFTGAGGNGVISIDTNDTSRVLGTVSGNQITNPPGIGMFVAVDEAATNDIVFDNNTITNSGGDGIQAVNFGGVGVSTMQLAITNNLVNGHSANTAQSFVGGISFTGFEDTSCVVLRGNNVIGTPASPTQCGGAPCVDHYLEEVGGTLTLEEVPNTAATTANAAYINSINDAGPVTVFGTIDLTNGATCNVALMADGFARRASRRPAAVDEDRLAKLVLHVAKRLRAESATTTATEPERTSPPALGLRLTDLAPGQLGRVAGGHISLDRDAAGWGWFIDPTPDEDEEFEPASPETGERRAKPGGPADGKMDLLTALMHEMGHVRGEIDVDAVSHAGELMAAKLKPGVRRSPPAVQDRRNDGRAFPE